MYIELDKKSKIKNPTYEIVGSAKLMNNIKGNVILVKSVARINFSGSDLKPGAIIDTNKGINNSIRITSPNREKVNRLKTLFAKFSEFFLDFVNSIA